jgi:NADPH-dependent 2,4-dienoyl-CoA reductase/sulfur reductase-like enzyme
LGTDVGACMRVVIVGGSDAGIEAARRCREVDPAVDVRLLVADAYPNFSICGIPYYVSGEVPDWRALAHRTSDDLADLGITVMTEHRVESIDPTNQVIRYTAQDRADGSMPYDRLLLATGATPRRPPIPGLAELGAADGLHVLHTMGDTFALQETLSRIEPGSTVAVMGAGYVGLEMAEALVARGFDVVVLEAELAADVESRLRAGASTCGPAPR